MKLYTQRSNMS